MKPIYFGLYTLFLLLVWGFFVIAKLHAYKFKNFSTNIVIVTNILLFFLLFLSILGYVFIFLSPTSTNTNRASLINKQQKMNVETNITTDLKSKFNELNFEEINY